LGFLIHESQLPSKVRVASATGRPTTCPDDALIAVSTKPPYEMRSYPSPEAAPRVLVCDLGKSIINIKEGRFATCYFMDRDRKHVT
jgi:hypothetical protein